MTYLSNPVGITYDTNLIISKIQTKNQQVITLKKGIDGAINL